MTSMNVKGKEIEIDESGFLINPTDWNEDVVNVLASIEGIEVLNDEHWHIINYIRDYFNKYQTAPMIRKLCKETGCDNKHMNELFPSGPLGACKLAGLTKPTGCV